MGFFDIISDIGETIASPVRGIGRILRGNVRQGLRDIGGAVSKAAPVLAFIPGIGTGAALGIGALSGALGSKRGADFGDVISGAAGGAARAGMGSAARGLMGAGGAAADAATAGAGGGAGGAATTASNVARGASGIGKLARIAKDVGSVAKDVAPLASIGAQAYGAHQLGKAEDRRAERQYEDEDRRKRVAQSILERGRRSGRFG